MAHLEVSVMTYYRYQINGVIFTTMTPNTKLKNPQKLEKIYVYYQKVSIKSCRSIKNFMNFVHLYIKEQLAIVHSYFFLHSLFLQ